MTGVTRAGLRGYVQLNTHTYTYTHSKNCRESMPPSVASNQKFPLLAVSLIPPLEGPVRVHRMTKMAGPDCTVMCNLISIYKRTQTQTYKPRGMTCTHLLSAWSMILIAVVTKKSQSGRHLEPQTDTGGRGTYPLIQ